MPNILVVEDDENLNRGITFSLKKSGYEVFSAESVKKAKRIASDNISDEKTFEREYSPLLAIRDAYPKMIIARTHHETYDYKGVQVVDICRWLRG